uniref:Uncharacterized protein n=1 Tax=Caenorhabditis japonica TaxID=281687 RepID=A0A8R1EW17_CAEJA
MPFSCFMGFKWGAQVMGDNAKTDPKRMGRGLDPYMIRYRSTRPVEGAWIVLAWVAVDPRRRGKSTKYPRPTHVPSVFDPFSVHAPTSASYPWERGS